MTALVGAFFSISPLLLRILVDGRAPSGTVLVIAFFGSVALGLVFLITSGKWPELRIWNDPVLDFFKHVTGAYISLLLALVVLGHYKSLALVAAFTVGVFAIFSEITSIKETPMGGLSGAIEKNVLLPLLIKIHLIRPAVRVCSLLRLHAHLMKEQYIYSVRWEKVDLKEDQWQYLRSRVILVDERLEIMVPLQSTDQLVLDLEVWEPGLRSILQEGIGIKEDWRIRHMEGDPPGRLKWSIEFSTANFDQRKVLTALTDSISLYGIFCNDLAPIHRWIGAMALAKRENADLRTQVLAGLSAEIDHLKEHFKKTHVRRTVVPMLDSIEKAIATARSGSWKGLVKHLDYFLSYNLGSGLEFHETPLNELYEQNGWPHQPFFSAVLEWIKSELRKQ